MTWLLKKKEYHAQEILKNTWRNEEIKTKNYEGYK